MAHFSCDTNLGLALSNRTVVQLSGQLSGLLFIGTHQYSVSTNKKCKFFVYLTFYIRKICCTIDKKLALKYNMLSRNFALLFLVFCLFSFFSFFISFFFSRYIALHLMKLFSTCFGQPKLTMLNKAIAQ